MGNREASTKKKDKGQAAVIAELEAQRLARAIAENTNGGGSLLELAYESGYFPDLSESEVAEKYNLLGKVGFMLVRFYGWSKVQRWENGRRVRFYPSSSRIVQEFAQRPD